MGVHHSSLELQVLVSSKGEQEVLAVVFEVTQRGSRHIQNQGLHLPVSLEIGVGLFEVLNQAALALDPSVGYFADLLRVEALPPFSIQLFKKFEDKNRVNEVDESVSDVAPILKG